MIAGDAVAGGQKGRIDGWPARTRRVEDPACPARQGHGHVGLEQLCYVQRFEIVRHSPVGQASEAIQIDPGISQVLLQA
jgi:hypothetical protein